MFKVEVTALLVEEIAVSKEEGSLEEDAGTAVVVRGDSLPPLLVPNDSTFESSAKSVEEGLREVTAREDPGVTFGITLGVTPEVNLGIVVVELAVRISDDRSMAVDISSADSDCVLEPTP